jgi:hypothetical protein
LKLHITFWTSHLEQNARAICPMAREKR